MPKRSSGDEGVESTAGAASGAAGAGAPGFGADVGVEAVVGGGVGVEVGASLWRRAISRS